MADTANAAIPFDGVVPLSPVVKQQVIDDCVAAFNGAIKYVPMLADRGDVADVDALKVEMLATAKLLHGVAIEYLRAELKRERYAGKTVEEIQTMLMEPHNVDAGFGIVYIDQPAVGRIWHGIPYARNLPSIANITEALEKVG